MISGVYKITNLNNGKIYVGSSIDIKRRWNDHKSDLRQGRHKAKPLQYDYDQFGLESFEFTILESLESDGVLIRQAEQRWLDQLEPYKNGYNTHSSSKGGAGSRQSPEAKAKQIAAQTGRVMSAETRVKISQAKKGKPGRPMSESNKLAIKLSRNK